jgi:5-methyltetrahydropteroyltriglutamate--homocysteine methyltransferase
VVIAKSAKTLVAWRVPSINKWIFDPGVVNRSNLIEHPELVTNRIITEVVGQENVIAGTDCGLGGRVHPQIAWAKLRALRDGAALASKKLWS